MFSEANVVGNQPDDFPDFQRIRFLAYIVPSDGGISAGLRYQATKHTDGGGFSRAVWAEETENFAVVHMQSKIVYGG